MMKKINSTERVTIADVADAAGVSKMSVTLAFRSNSRVSAETRERIFKIADELHYIPNQAARQLRSGKAATIGFIVTDICNPFHAMMVKRAEIAFNALGFDLLVGSSNWQQERENAFMEKLAGMSARGVLLCSCEKDDAGLTVLRNANIPCVAVDTASSQFALCPKIINDFEECGRLMADHFLEIGVRKPAYITADSDKLYFSAFGQIFEAFEKRLLSHGVRILPENRISGGLTISAGAAAFRSLMARKSVFDGIFCVNDPCAFGVMNEAEKHGLFAGSDFAIGGIDDIEESALSRISLTSVRQPYEEIVNRAISVLSGMIEGKPCRKILQVMPQYLQIRRSTSDFENKTFLKNRSLS